MTGIRAVGPNDVAGIEAGSLASDLAHAYGRMATFYRDEMEMSGPDADARARGADGTPAEAAADLQRIMDRPPDQVSWFDLQRVVNRDPEAVADLWQVLRAAARDELDSGHRTARALDWDGSPWQRAAIRDNFRADYCPHPGVETALVDVAAFALGDFLEWSEQLHMQARVEADLEHHDLKMRGTWKPQRLSSSQHLEQSARMADRAHVRFLRTIAVLEGMREPERVTIQTGGLTIQQQAIVLAPLPGQQGEG